MSSVRGPVRIPLRLEGLALAVITLALVWNDLPVFWLVITVLVLTDLAILGYISGNRTGAVVYGAAHSRIRPFAVFEKGLFMGETLMQVGAGHSPVHVGVERVVGYGFKYASGFKRSRSSWQD